MFIAALWGMHARYLIAYDICDTINIAINRVFEKPNKLTAWLPDASRQVLT